MKPEYLKWILTIMPMALLEIVELENGEIVLRRADENNTPLLSIRFSDASNVHLNRARLEIAKAMIEAGMDAAGSFSEVIDPNADTDNVMHTLH